MVIEIVKPETVEGEEVQMVDLFVLDGTTYQIPDRVQPNLSLRYLGVLRANGEDLAEQWLGVKMMGANTYMALINCEHITQEQSDAIWNEARAIAFGDRRPKEPMAPKPSTPRTPRTTTKPAPGSRSRKRPSKATSADSTE